ncbi:fibronectin type III domain-containing protein [Tenacibaculum sp. Mcav3-52]|uniref:fibronectin type III domain-containing protein n=1 Tax=Tenacibaculum sp. Mcav3-52 TaxID=2917762 RepID=UPI001EF28559|nr:fibronectin type III domain-containing protein [Tenacibaculum sp. Mcav3-52]MCG7501616.1 fibronectin type III domain-containing protein [Tenacibaculum sp. Mcav3-52]
MNVSKLKYRLKQSLFFYCLLLVVGVYAQRYPVQVTQTIIPPYSTKLSDYATASDVKFRLNLLLTDVVANNKQVRLKLHIKGNGFDIQSTDFVTGASQVILNGGVLQQFTNIDLAAYFQPNNLIGISPQQYNKPLPEGMYSFCWEVYDAYTNQQLNHPTAGCSNVYLVLNDPPFLNLPYKGDQIVAQDPMNIIFQWTPRHTNATNVSYEFELRELWDTQVDPQAAFLASPNYYSETTYTTTLLYNIGKPTLLPNRRYGWRVKAKSTTGVSENSIFKNDGYSEIYYFTYTNACYPPTFVLSEVVAKDRIKLTWQGHPDHKKYHVQYKRADIPDAEWFEVYTYNTQAQISNLREGKTYMFRVGGTCNELTDFDQNYSYSHMSQFTMPAKDEMGSSYNCGIIPEIQIDNNDPLKNIGINETFTAGDFPVTVKQIQGGNGTFTGVGYIVVPYLGDTKIAVTFDAISINTDYQLIEGVVKTTYDPTWGDVEDTNDWTQGGTGNSESTEVDFPVSDVQIDPNGDILVIGENGEVVELPGGEDIVITDSNGQVWAVDEEGNVTPQGTQAEGGASNPENTNGVNNNGQATAISAKGVIVTFKKASNSKYGFDSYESNYSATKDLYKKLDNNYYVPYKAVAKNDTETIVANLAITDSKIKPQDIVFKTKDGVAITKIDSTATSYTLELKGVFDDAEIETQALVKQGTKYEVAGAFIQYQATPKNVKVVVVNTSNTSARTIKESLQKIYQQAMVNLTITEINDFKNDLETLAPNGTIQSGESGFAAQYTEQQRQINNKLKQHSQYQQDAYYLIVTDKTPSFTSEKGLMPLGRQFGYVYTTNCSTADCVALTAAHELGHGAFQLKHPFSSQSYQYAQKATNWLLDYKDGTKLPFVHWQAIHNPKLRIGVFDKDSEGQNTVISGIPKEFANPDNTFTFLTLNGSYITLPKKVKKLSFVTGVDKLNPYVHYPTGALQSFEIDSVKYSASVDEITIQDEYTIENFGFIYNGFKGYNVEERKEYHKNIITLVPDGDSRRLLKSKVEGVNFKEREEINILKSDTYNKLQAVTDGKFKIFEKKYKYGDTTPYDESYKLNKDLVQEVFGENLEINDKYFILSKIAFLNNSYPDIISTTASQMGYSKLRALRTKNESELISIYLKFINEVKTKLGNCKETLDNITVKSSFNRVKSCIDNLSNQELSKVSVANKIIAISILTQRGIPTNNSAEIEIIRLLKFTKNEDVDNLLTALLGKSKINTEDFLLKRLAYKIDNDHTWLTDDNYKKFVEVLIGLSSKSDLFKKKALEYTDEEFADRIINFYHRGFWDFMKEVGSNVPSAFFYTCNLDTKVDWDSEKTVDISIHNEMSCNAQNVYKETPVPLSPLDPIWFVNKSSLSMLSDYNKETPVIAPAMLAYYANDVGDTKNTIDGIEATIDVVSLATGAGALAKAPSTLRKVYIIADMVGSGVNITLESSSKNLSSNAKIFLESLNILTASIAIDEFLKDGVKSINKLYKKVAKKNTKPLPSIKQVNSFIDNILTEDLTATQIAEIGANKLRESEKWLDNIIAEGKINSELTDLAVRARNAKVKLELAKELLKITPDNLKSIINLTGGEITSVKNYINKSDDYIDVIVHSDKVGDKFSVVVEIEGKVENIILSAKDFAKTLNDIPKEKTIRLLSCNNVESAQDIAVVLNRNIVASRGEMKLYDNGLIETDSWFIAKGDGKIEDFKPNRYNLDVTDEYIILGKKLDDPLLEAIRVGKRSDGTLELALRNAGFNKCADAVKGASKVNANNTRLLNSGDPSIPNLVDDYSFVRNGKLFKKGTPTEYANETWNDYFKRLNKILEEQGETVRFFNQFESHHIFPVDLFKNESFRKWYELVGHQHFDINGVDSLENLIMLEAIRRKPLSDAGKPNFVGGVHTNHPKYTEKISKYVEKLWNDAKINANWDDAKIAREIDDDIMILSENLKQSLLQNSVRGSVELPSYWKTINFNDLIK